MATKRKREEEKMEVKRKKEELKQQAELQEQEKVLSGKNELSFHEIVLQLRKSNLSKQFFMNFFSKKDTSVKVKSLSFCDEWLVHSFLRNAALEEILHPMNHFDSHQ